MAAGPHRSPPSLDHLNGSGFDHQVAHGPDFLKWGFQSAALEVLHGPARCICQVDDASFEEFDFSQLVQVCIAEQHDYRPKQVSVLNGP